MTTERKTTTTPASQAGPTRPPKARPRYKRTTISVDVEVDISDVVSQLSEEELEELVADTPMRQELAQAADRVYWHFRDRPDQVTLELRELLRLLGVGLLP